MEVQCPTCSAKFAVPDTVSVATCPYCGTTFEVESREKVGEHFFFPPVGKDPAGLLLKFISREYGAPADIVDARVKAKVLHYVPVHFFYIHGNLMGSTAEEVMLIGIPAVEKFKELLRDYPFPVRGKRFFDENIVKKGKYYEPEIGREEAEEEAISKVVAAIRAEARDSGDRFSEERLELDVHYQGLVHYPIWEVHYEYGGEEFHGFVDGADGRVIEAKYPMTSEARKKAGVLGGGILAAGIVAGIIFGTAGGFWGFLGGFIPGLAGAVPILFKSARRIQTTGQIRRVYEHIHFRP